MSNGSGANDTVSLHARADALLADALDLPEEARAELIASRTTSDPALRAAVEQLLRLAAAPAPAFDAAIEADASRHARARRTSAAPQPLAASDPLDGQRIGAWRVVRRIGHGGMGTVFLVERADGQYDQRAALKLVHAHAADVEAHQRFARERRILASLDHACVARLLDGGQTADGRLYFVMEYVEGRPIDRFCDETRATIDRRLELFQQVCAGVQHAHDRLVVHRDLKPSNILVTNAGDVKLLDFGIARLLSDDGAPATRLLTPEYASPEQWRGEPVATVSDVYQLGLLLYELLTGERAQWMAKDAAGTPRSIERIVCDTIPLPPSARVKAAAPAIAAARRVSRSTLARRLSGDLDNITLFALRKEPGRRYASVRDLTDDVQRHRRGRAVKARGDDVLYRGGRFVARHRIAAAVAAAALAAVTAAMVLIAGERRAAREAAYAEQVEDLIVELFSLPRAGAQPGQEGPPRAKDYVDQAAAAVRRVFDGQPERQSRLLGQVGRAYNSLGHYQPAMDVLRQAVALREASSGPHDPGLAQVLEWLGEAELYSGRYTDAEASLRRALAIRQARRGETGAAVTWSMLDLGDLLHTLGRLPEAEQMFADAIPILRREEATVPLARALTDYGNVLRDRGRFDAAEASFRESLALFRPILPARNAQAPLTSTYLARLLIMRGRPEDLTDADAMLNMSLTMLRGLFEDEHPLTAIALKELGYLRTEQGRHAEAEARLNEAQAMIERRLGANHPQAPRARVHQAELARRQGRAAEAIALGTRALDELNALGLTDHPAAIDARLVIGEALRSQQRATEALSILHDGLARAERQFVQGDARTARFRALVSSLR